MSKLFLFLVAALTLFGCASFSDNYTNGNIIKLNNQNLSQLNGNYKIYASGKYDDKGHFTSISIDKKKYPLYKKIENKLPDLKNRKDIEKIIKSVSLDSLPSLWDNYDQVEVKIRGKYVSFSLLKSNKTIKIFNFEGTMKKGFLYLPKEKNCVKIPSVVSGCVKSQRRIGLTEDGGLLLHEYNKANSSSQYTSFFLSLLEGDGDAAYKYEKVK